MLKKSIIEHKLFRILHLSPVPIWELQVQRLTFIYTIFTIYYYIYIYDLYFYIYIYIYQLGISGKKVKQKIQKTLDLTSSTNKRG